MKSENLFECYLLQVGRLVYLWITPSTPASGSGCLWLNFSSRHLRTLQQLNPREEFTVNNPPPGHTLPLSLDTVHSNTAYYCWVLYYSRSDIKVSSI